MHARCSMKCLIGIPRSPLGASRARIGHHRSQLGHPRIATKIPDHSPRTLGARRNVTRPFPDRSRQRPISSDTPRAHQVFDQMPLEHLGTSDQTSRLCSATLLGHPPDPTPTRDQPTSPHNATRRPGSDPNRIRASGTVAPQYDVVLI